MFNIGLILNCSYKTDDLTEYKYVKYKVVISNSSMRPPFYLNLIFVFLSPWFRVKGDCPEDWSDATLVDLGCLLFSEDIMFWTEADKYCDSLLVNASMVEILTPEVRF